MPQTSRPWFRAATGWWMAQVDRHQVKLAEGKANKKQAEKKLREILTLKDHNPSPESGRLTVASVIELYLEHAKTKYSERSLYGRKLILQDFAEAHGFRLVNDKDCLPYHLTSWLDGHADWKSDWTKAHAVAVVHRPFNWAAKQRLVAANPFRGITHRTGEPRRPMTDDEFHALLKAANAGRRKPAEDRYPNGRKVCPSDLRKRARVTAGERFRELLTFLRYTGARPGEASRLRWEDIDLEEKVIRILRHKTSKTQRVKKPRIIPLHPVVLTLLIEIKRRNENAEYVFLTQRKSLWKRCNLSLRMQRAREAAGVADDAKLYGLHHGFGTRAVLNGVDIKTLSELLGHTSTKMSEHYIHLGGQTTHLARAMEQVNRPTQPPDATTPREGAPRPDC